jgi:hypothetical protein
MTLRIESVLAANQHQICLMPYRTYENSSRTPSMFEHFNISRGEMINETISRSHNEEKSAKRKQHCFRVVFHKKGTGNETNF